MAFPFCWGWGKRLSRCDRKLIKNYGSFMGSVPLIHCSRGLFLGVIFDAFGSLSHYDFPGDPRVLSCHAFSFSSSCFEGLPRSFRLVRWRRTPNWRSAVVPLASRTVFDGLTSIDMYFHFLRGLFPLFGVVPLCFLGGLPP